MESLETSSKGPTSETFAAPQYVVANDSDCFGFA
jgi:hypothetical protein